MLSRLSIVLSLSLVLTVSGTASAQQTIVIRNNSSTLQEAIDAASPGDLIDIGSPGTGQSPFVENVVIDKPLTIFGSPIQLIIAADPSKPVVTIKSDGVELRSLEVREGSFGIMATNSDNLTLFSVRSQRNSFDGVRIRNCNSFGLFDVRAFSNERYGVHQTGGTGEYEETRAFLNRTGFLVRGSIEPLFFTCFAFDNDSVGFDLRDCERALSFDSLFFRNLVGVSVDDSIGTTMVDAFVSENGIGYDLASCDGTISGGFVRDNVTDGIVGDADSSWLFSDLLVTNNGGDGIALAGSGNEIEDSLFRDNDGAGVRISGGNNSLVDVTSRRNQVGFEISGDDNLVAQCKSSRSVAEGYRIFDASNNDFFGNVAESDGADGFLIGDVTDSAFTLVRALRCGGNGIVFSDQSVGNSFVDGFAGLNALFGIVDEGSDNEFDNTFCDDEGNGSGGSFPAGICD